MLQIFVAGDRLGMSEIFTRDKTVERGARDSVTGTDLVDEVTGEPRHGLDIVSREDKSPETAKLLAFNMMQSMLGGTLPVSAYNEMSPVVIVSNVYTYTFKYNGAEVFKITVTDPTGTVSSITEAILNNVILEDGFNVLLEDGGQLLLEG
jgi:hypothetical protein